MPKNDENYVIMFSFLTLSSPGGIQSSIQTFLLSSINF